MRLRGFGAHGGTVGTRMRPRAGGGWTGRHTAAPHTYAGTHMRANHTQQTRGDSTDWKAGRLVAVEVRAHVQWEVVVVEPEESE